MLCRGAFFISNPLDASGAEEAGGKGKTPKIERALKRFIWVQAE